MKRKRKRVYAYIGLLVEKGEKKGLPLGLLIQKEEKKGLPLGLLVEKGEKQGLPLGLLGGNKRERKRERERERIMGSAHPIFIYIGRFKLCLYNSCIRHCVWGHWPPKSLYINSEVLEQA